MIAGFGLHTGRRSVVTLRRAEGPLRVRADGVEIALSDLVPDGAARSTVLRARDGRVVVATVEHLFAALEARSIRSGLAIELEGAELPLLDGGARAWADALPADLAPGPRLVVATAATIHVGASAYVFAPGEGVHVSVAIAFDDARIAPDASWSGDAADFRDRIAPARTFGFAHEVGDLLARGLATHVTPESVVVFTDAEVLAAGAPYTADEPARHKLIDLLGDLYVHGGAPRGSLHAARPGHAATHEAMRRALEAGVVRRPDRADVTSR
ncbi:MAG: UDP-3-O-acyl-N-acetylglucosamine deacetylase [Labilithrix sp.]|nr:UDP-3-O-acyl-N-acetylglucosamine deacetylase [Labilithrix sp.]MCW5815154.1 UDP-3-O-acyl-N-acetylglucosamine deacetylase [Labilithrix sp.]